MIARVLYRSPAGVTIVVAAEGRPARDTRAVERTQGEMPP
jgi:hypothetical protein